MSYLDLHKDINHQIFLRLPMDEIRKYPIKFNYDFMTEWVKIYSSCFLKSQAKPVDLYWPVALTNLNDCPIKYQNCINETLASYNSLLLGGSYYEGCKEIWKKISNQI